MKNWTGNKNSTFSTLGASNHSDYERADNDFYATDPVAIDLLLEKIKELDIKIIRTFWECACGNGHLAERLKAKHNKVYCTDIIQREYPLNEVLDFLSVKEKTGMDILTNPPYKYAQEFVEKAMELLLNGRYLFMFLKLTFLEGQKRKKMFEKYPPKYVLVFSKRIQVARNGDEEMFKKSSAAAYAWFIWEKGFIGKPTIDWL